MTTMNEDKGTVLIIFRNVLVVCFTAVLDE